MKAKELIGHYATRTAPAQYPNGTSDRSYIGDVLFIKNADDEFISFKHHSCCLPRIKTFYLGVDFCDDNWKNVDDFVEETE